MICGWRNLIKNIPHFAKFNEEVRHRGAWVKFKQKIFHRKGEN